MAKAKFLESKHPVWDAQSQLWRIQERRLRGGAEILAELKPFDWESTRDALVAPMQDVRMSSMEQEATEALAQALAGISVGAGLTAGEHYRQRQGEATYLNFPYLFMYMMVGHLMAQAPVPDVDLQFGGLGNVKRVGKQPSRAELVYYNADGKGRDGSQWNTFWGNAMMRAGATGHRWIMVDATKQKPRSFEDELRGLRPYLVEYSPRRVINWHYEDGQLQFAVIRNMRRNPRVNADGELDGNRPEPTYLLLVREGFGGLGAAYKGGGWWEHDKEYEPIAGGTGKWEGTKGEIPLFPLYYERDTNSDEAMPAMSRSGTFELAQLAVSYMNLASSADFDLQDAAQSIIYLLGVDVDSFNIAATKRKEGNQMIPVPRDGDGNVPAIYDGSTGAIVNTAFEKRFETKRSEGREIASRESSSTPDSSGRSKEVGFADTKGPRLSTMAAEMEAGQNTGLVFLEMRFGIASPSAYVTWPRKFDIAPLVDDIEAFLNLENLAGLHSPTMDANVMMMAAQEHRLLGDETQETKIKGEYLKAATTKADTAEKMAQASADLGFGGNDA